MIGARSAPVFSARAWHVVGADFTRSKRSGNLCSYGGVLRLYRKEAEEAD